MGEEEAGRFKIHSRLLKPVRGGQAEAGARSCWELPFRLQALPAGVKSTILQAQGKRPQKVDFSGS